MSVRKSLLVTILLFGCLLAGQQNLQAKSTVASGEIPSIRISHAAEVARTTSLCLLRAPVAVRVIVMEIVADIATVRSAHLQIAPIAY